MLAKLKILIVEVSEKTNLDQEEFQLDPGPEAETKVCFLRSFLPFPWVSCADIIDECAWKQGAHVMNTASITSRPRSIKDIYLINSPRL